MQQSIYDYKFIENDIIKRNYVSYISYKRKRGPYKKGYSKRISFYTGLHKFIDRFLANLVTTFIAS